MSFVLPPRPEHFVLWDHYRLHVQSWGPESAVTVVFEAGLGGCSLHWLKVAQAVAGHARVLVYDRAGYGWSTPAHSTVGRDSRQLAQELRQMLALQGCTPPYLLVGHSFGGFIVRCFVNQYPEQVAAVVLVDAVHEDEWSQRFPLTYRLADRAMVSALACLEWLARWGLLGWLEPLHLGNSRSLPQEFQDLGSKLMLQAAYLDTARRELAAMPQSAQQAAEATFPNLPLRVIGRGQAETVLGLPLLPGKLEQRLRILQRKLSQLSSRAKRLTAKQSRHDIHLESPDSVTETILQLL